MIIATRLSCLCFSSDRSSAYISPQRNTSGSLSKPTVARPEVVTIRTANAQLFVALYLAAFLPVFNPGHYGVLLCGTPPDGHFQYRKELEFVSGMLHKHTCNADGRDNQSAC